MQETVEERRERKREAGERLDGQERTDSSTWCAGRADGSSVQTHWTQRRDSGSMPGDGRQGDKRGCKREVQETNHRN